VTAVDFSPHSFDDSLPSGCSPIPGRTLIAEETRKWASVIRAANIKP
jgi:hypothetical protein